MNIFSGNPASQIWLIGDSNPKNWDDELKEPFDPRHPAIHNIWTPVFEQINEIAFKKGLRLDTEKLYIRNAIEAPDDKPQSNTTNWNDNANKKLAEFKELLNGHNPVVVISFGSFSFEFCRRAIDHIDSQPFRKWGAKALGGEFRNRVDNFLPDKTNLMPLLHVSIARGKFLASHEYFTGVKNGNYFEYVGTKICLKFLEFQHYLPVWV